MKDNIKFIRNIIITVIALIIVAIIINFTPGYKIEKYGDITNLVYGKENITHKLKYQLYINNGEIYISKLDIEKLIIKEPLEESSDLTIENVEYIKLKDIAEKFNLQANLIAETNILVIDNLNNALKKATVMENTNLQFKARNLSKTIREMQEGENVTYFDEDDFNGWKLVRTDNGEIGYIESNKIVF